MSRHGHRNVMRPVRIKKVGLIAHDGIRALCASSLETARSQDLGSSLRLRFLCSPHADYTSFLVTLDCAAALSRGIPEQARAEVIVVHLLEQIMPRLSKASSVGSAAENSGVSGVGLPPVFNKQCAPRRSSWRTAFAAPSWPHCTAGTANMPAVSSTRSSWCRGPTICSPTGCHRTPRAPTTPRHPRG